VNGVDLNREGKVGVSVTGALRDSRDRRIGTSTGFPYSSATSWSTGSVSYQVILHCTATAPA